ncbi:hypothetical protein HDZ31DRAFT_60839 [Schizophyllum fasciatum]
MGVREEYVPLATAIGASDDVEQRAPQFSVARNAWQAWRMRLLLAAVIVQFAAIVILLSRPSSTARSPGDTHFTYSPGEQALEDELVVFGAGSERKSLYQELTDEADEAWKELYDPSVVKLTREEAVRLPNRTHPITHGADGFYLGQLDVFHQLHCLNYLRMSLSPERYKPIIREDLLEFEHLNHCIDSIRQSLMCSSDISVNVWQWSEHYEFVAGRVNVAHSCRSFDKLREWTRGRLAPEHPIDQDEYVEYDLPFPPIYHSAADLHLMKTR